MKNMKIRTKLISSFLIVAIMAAVVGGVGIMGMSRISAADTSLYESNLLAVNAMGTISDRISQMRVHIRNIVIYNADTDTYKNSEKALTTMQAEVKEHMDEYQATIADQEDQDNFNEIKRLYNDVLLGQTIPNTIKAGAVNDSEGAREAMDATASDISKLNDLLDDSMEYNTEYAAKVAADNQTLSMTMTIISVVVLAFAMIVSISLGLYIAGLIGRPTRFLSGLMVELVKTGNFNTNDTNEALVQKYSASKDETGDIARAYGSLMDMLNSKCATLQTVASGDLTVNIEHISESDTMGNAMQKMADSLNNMFTEINSATAQVSSGSKQIADGAQALAQGSTEQAASVQQLSASINEVSHKTKLNADMASHAADLSNNIRGNAQKGSVQMDQMMQAVREINAASQNISKVIKAIDDIAFQTNILALNAAVEAARAGQHGKGFAVVAEEVRNLAAKSADAAKETGGLIANSVEKAELGARIADETAASLNEIVAGINESTEIITKIAQSSEEQASSINEINTGIDQVAQVIQQNSATSEQSAAASEEMSGQATLLGELVARFKIKDSISYGVPGHMGGMSLGM